ncbi:hypothetical protein NDU88_008554 [Pleurodeles waltl]|uniref:G-protein coupled receptors family 1 profile domain-containing protein n=1 Tax=Pleurodeles waltl TaxID=8319 RepID=A0AAV7NZK2_PLEWA|nr:hypothetical protein NDU88_008554 [Pleurodeles waltl]
MSWVTLITITAFGFLPSFIDTVILFSVVKVSYFSTSVVCRLEAFLITPEQSTLLSAKHGFTFTIVALIILYTYIRIMLEAKKISGDRTSSSKASRTVALHAVQLLLCMTSFTYPVTEALVKDQLHRSFVFRDTHHTPYDSFGAPQGEAPSKVTNHHPTPTSGECKCSAAPSTILKKQSGKALWFPFRSCDRNESAVQFHGFTIVFFF